MAEPMFMIGINNAITIIRMTTAITININGNAPDLEARVQRAIHKTMRESGVVVEG